MSPREGQVGRHGVAERSAVPLKPGNAGYCAASMRATGTASSAIHRRRCTRARQAAPSAICRAVHGLGTPTSNDVRSSTIRSRSPARRKLRRTYTPSSARCRLARSRSRQCKTLSTCCEPRECANRRAARRNLIASLITNWRYRRSVQKLRPRQKQAAFPLCRPFEIERSARGSAMELRSCRNYSWHPIASIRSAPSLPGRPTPRAVTQCCGNRFRRRPKCAEVVLRVSVLRHPQTRVLVGPRTRTLHRWQVVKAQRRACAAAARAAARRIAARILVPRDRTSVAGASHRS